MSALLFVQDSLVFKIKITTNAQTTKQKSSTFKKWLSKTVVILTDCLQLFGPDPSVTGKNRQKTPKEAPTRAIQTTDTAAGTRAANAEK